MGHTDQKYIDALLTNDATILRQLYENYSGKIQKMVLQNKGTEADAADIFQEALVAIFHKAKEKGFQLTCPLDAFLYLVCKNKWINELNKRKSRGVTFIDVDGYNSVGEETFRAAENCKTDQERYDLLNEKLEQLGESCRQLLKLSWTKISMEEVADMLKVSYGYARKKKSECMAQLIQLVKSSAKFNTLKW